MHAVSVQDQILTRVLHSVDVYQRQHVRWVRAVRVLAYSYAHSTLTLQVLLHHHARYLHCVEAAVPFPQAIRRLHDVLQQPVNQPDQLVPILQQDRRRCFLWIHSIFKIYINILFLPHLTHPIKTSSLSPASRPPPSPLLPLTPALSHRKNITSQKVTALSHSPALPFARLQIALTDISVLLQPLGPFAASEAGWNCIFLGCL